MSERRDPETETPAAGEPHGSPPPPDEQLDDDAHDDEWVPEDDAVIGRAFRRSLVAIVAVSALVALVLWLRGRPGPAGPEQAIDVAAPERVAETGVRPEIPFTDVTAEAGIAFVHQSGAYGDKLLPETMGGGVAFFDYDADGDADLLFVNSSAWPHADPIEPAPTPALYANDGRGRFRDVTAEVGLDFSFYGMGAAAADYDGDGQVDLFLTAVGPNRLLRNVGGRFEDVTATAGVAGDDDEWSTGAAFFDADGDGDLDLFVANYVRWSKEIDFQQDFRLTGVGRAYGPPQNYEGTYPYFYVNDGDGTFTEASAEAGFRVDNPATGRPMAKGLGLGVVDVDRDGLLDLLVANDTVQNFFFHNRGEGRFEETGELWGLAYDRQGSATGAMGVDAAYYRNDDEIGFAIGNFANEMTSLYVSQGDPTFYVDEAIGEGIGAPSRRSLTFGLFAFDADLDGRLDLLAANGHLESEINRVDPSQTYRQPAQLFWNAGPEAPQGFVDLPPEELGDLARPLVGRGAAYADLDGDGDLDVVITQVDGPPLLARNDQATGHHWLRVRLVGDGANRDAIGAVVELTAGGVTQRRTVMPIRSYLSQVELPVTFGLGEATAVDSLVVTWPDGSEQSVEVAGVDRLVTVEKSVVG